MDAMAVSFPDLSTEEIEKLVAKEIAAMKAERSATRLQASGFDSATSIPETVREP